MKILNMQHPLLRAILLLFALAAFETQAVAADVSNRAATTFSLRDTIAQFVITAVANEATQAAQQRQIAEIVERFRTTYKVDPAQSLYHVLHNNPEVTNLQMCVDNTSGESHLKAMNFEIVRLDFDFSETSYSIFALLTRAGAQHVQPESFVGVDRIVLSQNGTSRTVSGVEVVGLLASLYKTVRY